MRTYLLILSIPVAAIVALGVWALHSEISREAEPVQAVAVESSRPLNKEAKAPADWTGDGKADGWLLGEWLPGQEGTVYLSGGEQVRAPLEANTLTAIVFAFILFLAALVFAVSVFIYDSLRRQAVWAAERDWRLAVSALPRDFDNGVPLWVR